MSGNGEEFPVDPFGTAGEGRTFEQSLARDRRREAAAEAVQQFNEQLPEGSVTREDLVLTDEGFRLSDDAEREVVAQQLDAELPKVDIGTGDLVESDGQFRVDEATSQTAAAAELDAEIEERTVTADDVVATAEDGFRLSDAAQRDVAAAQIDADVEVRDVTSDDIVETEDGFTLSDAAQRDVAAAQIDEETLTDVTPGDLTETDEGFALAEPVRRDEVRRQIIDQDEGVDPEDISGIDELTPAEQVDVLLQERPELVEGEGGDANPKAREDLLELARQDQLDEEFEDVNIPELGPEFTDEFRREQALTSIVESEEDVDREDIASLEETGDGFRVEFTEQFQRERVAESIAEETTGITTDDINPSEDIKAIEETEEGIQPELSQDLRQELAAAESEELQPQDIRRIEDLSPEEQVEFIIENDPAVDPATPQERQQARDRLTTLARQDRLDEVVDDVPEVNVEVTEDFQRQQVRETLVEENENIDSDDIKAVSELSPREQLGALLRSDERTVGEIQQEMQRIEAEQEQIRQRVEEGELTDKEAQQQLQQIDVPGAPEFGPEFTEEFQREQIAETLNDEFGDRTISKSDVVRVEDGDGFQLREGLRQEIAAEELDAQIDDREIGEEDLVSTGDGFRLKQAPGPAQALRKAQRQNPEFFAAIQLDRKFDQVDVTADDIIQGEGGLRFSEDLQRDLAVERIDDQIQEVDVGRGDIERVDGQFQLSDEVQQQVAAVQLDDEISAVDVGTGDLRQTPGGEFKPDTGLRRELTAQQLNEDIDEIDITASDLTSVPALRESIESGQRGTQPLDLFALDQAAQRELSASRLDEQFSGIDRTEAGIGLRPEEVAPDVDITEENIERTGAGLELDDDVRRQLAAVQIDRSLPVDVEASDLVETQRGFAPGEDVRAALQERAERSAAFRLSRELDRDISPDDVTTGPSGDIRISRDIREDLAFEQVQENTLIDVDRSDVEFGTKAEPDPFSVRGFGAQPAVDVRLTEDAARREQEALSSLEIDDGINADGQAFVTEGTVAPQADFTNDRGSATGEALDAVAGIESAIGDLPVISQTRGAVRAGTSFGVSKLSGAADVASIITDPVTSASRGGRQAAENFIVDPSAGLVGDIFGVTDRLTPRDTNIGGLVEGATAEFGGGAAAVTVGLPSTLGSGISTGTDITITAGETINEQGIVRGRAEIADTIADAGLRASRAGAQALQKRPFETIGRGIGALAIDTIAGTAAARSLEFGTTAARARVQARGGPKTDLEDLTPQQRELITQDGVAMFATSRTAPTKTAVAESRARARNVPKQLDDIVETDQVTFRSETSRLPKEFAAEVGEFELPGLYTAPDLSLLRFDQSSGVFGSGVSLRLPRLFAQPERVSAFETRNISGLPGDAAESGFAVRDGAGDIVERFPPTGEGGKQARILAEAIDGQRVPDPATAGAQFLYQTEDLETAFVRAPSDRTQEAEAIFPPGAEFERVTTGLVKTPQGASGTIDVFRPVRSKGRDTDSDIEGDDGFDESLPATDGETFTAEEISALSRRSRSRSLPDDSPLTPVPGLSGGSGGVSAPSPSSTRTTTPSRLEASGPGIAEGISESARRTQDIEAAGSVRRTISGVGRASGADAVGTGGLVIPEIERDGDSTGTGDRTRAPFSDPTGVTTGTPDLTTQGNPSFESDPVAPPTTPPTSPPTTSPPTTSPPTTPPPTTPPPTTPPPTTPPPITPPYTPPPTTPPFTPPPFTPPPITPPPGAGGRVPPRLDVGSDDGQVGDIKFKSEIAKQFEGGVVSPGSVLAGSLDEFGGLESSEPSVTVIDDDATPKVTKIQGEVPGVDEDDFSVR